MALEAIPCRATAQDPLPGGAQRQRHVDLTAGGRPPPRYLTPAAEPAVAFLSGSAEEAVKNLAFLHRRSCRLELKTLKRA